MVDPLDVARSSLLLLPATGYTSRQTVAHERPAGATLRIRPRAPWRQWLDRSLPTKPDWSPMEFASLSFSLGRRRPGPRTPPRRRDLAGR